jgi:subtilisin family serine protease
MSLLLVCLLAVWSRPVAPPVTADELAQVVQLEQVFETRPQVGLLPSGCEDAVPHKYVVGYDAGRGAEAFDWVTGRGGEVLRQDGGGRFLVVRLARPDESFESLRQDALSVPGVRWFERDYRVRATWLPNDPRFLTDQWGKWVMYADRAWDFGLGSNSVKLAIIDNGVEYWHPDLAGNFVTGQFGYDFVGGDDDPKPDDPGVTEAFHGTHVAGIAAAALDNGQGVAGWANVQLVAVRVLDDSGSGNTSDLASGIRWAADNGCDIINMSLGANAAPSVVVDACQYAAERGVLLVAAAGNEGTSPVQYPAGLGTCLCVGATDQFSGLAGFSNYGSGQEVVAPGVDILSTWVGSNYWYASGTSMSCPQVAGVAALVMSAAPDLNASRVRAIVDASAIDKGAAGRDDSFGYGLVNAQRALELAQLLARDGGVPGPDHSVHAGTVSAGTLELPAWCQRVDVVDASGRTRKTVSGRELELVPGTWFLLMQGRGRSERSRLLVVR